MKRMNSILVVLLFVVSGCVFSRGPSNTFYSYTADPEWGTKQEIEERVVSRVVAHLTASEVPFHTRYTFHKPDPTRGSMISYSGPIPINDPHFLERMSGAREHHRWDIFVRTNDYVLLPPFCSSEDAQTKADQFVTGSGFAKFPFNLASCEHSVFFDRQTRIWSITYKQPELGTNSSMVLIRDKP